MNNSTHTTPDQVEYAIEAKGLSKRFGNNIAVNKLDLKIPKGSIYGFLGPNGCGKSTSIRLLTGLLGASEGDVSILGKPLYDHQQTHASLTLPIGQWIVDGSDTVIASSIRALRYMPLDEVANRNTHHTQL
ncbi:ATP-binding cassette domain-containing protein [Marinomonas sp. RSW2]|uniref:ATP-binding cassette domain-containing protein n=1 Tax=Marinomonas maritima TaxID=2940935 RepID=A0ABT5WAS0_9GAMM|nr:ATP-binding cassette domain-containing protein [Marinomonas maritima]MDE8601802.1 ATP-binding cassette domain-containing protein [Marinomonas maritima]